MKRIGIYGGSFNPPHIGHMRAAQYALSALKLDTLLVIPSCESPGKQPPYRGASAQQRLAMTVAAMEQEPGIRVLDTEICRGGVSYTADTIAQIRQMHPQDSLYLLMGTDMFLSFLNWYEPGKIIQEATIGVFCRERKLNRQEIEAPKAALEAMGGEVILLDNPLTEISSTDIRRLLRFGCAEELLHPSVAEFIRENKLFDTGKSLRGLSPEELEAEVVALLKPNRVKHVLGCRDTAVQLAKHWGANQQDAARAGLLHDITKALDGPLQLTLCRSYGIVLDDFSKQNTKTLHALTGALVADRIFGENAAVVSAIHSHTTGKANMNMLEKIIYVADYMEPNRDFPGVEQLRHLAFTDIDAALKMGLEMTLAMLREQGREISPGSREALAWLNQK